MLGDLLLDVGPTPHAQAGDKLHTAQMQSPAHAYRQRSRQGTRSTAWLCLSKVLTLPHLQCYRDNSDQKGAGGHEDVFML